MSVPGILLLLGVSNSAAADVWGDTSKMFFQWCVDAPASQPLGGNRESDNVVVRLDRSTDCKRVAEARTKYLSEYANEYERYVAEHGQEAATQYYQGERQPIYVFASSCQEMQVVGSGRARSDGICVERPERLAESPFRFDLLPQERVHESAVQQMATRLVLSRHPVGTSTGAMVAALADAGFECDEIEDNTSLWTGECWVTYSVIAYSNFVPTWVGALQWRVSYRAATGGMLQSVGVSVFPAGL